MRRLFLVLVLAGLCAGLFVAPALASLPRPAPVERLRASLPALDSLGGGAVARGLDTSQRPTAAGYEAIAAAGYTFMGRYLEISPATAGEWGGKVYFLTASELASARAAGVTILLLFEWCDYAHRPTSYAQGVTDATIALAALARLGLPADSPVYYSLDRASKASIEQVMSYFEGVNSIVGIHSIGVYGSQAQLQALAGLVTYRWYATWMDGNNLPFSGWGNQMYQRTIIKRVGGVYCDQNWSYCRDIGVVGHDAAP